MKTKFYYKDKMTGSRIYKCENRKEALLFASFWKTNFYRKFAGTSVYTVIIAI